MVVGCILVSLIRFDKIYIAEIVKSNRSDDPRINNGISMIILLYLIHREDETIFIIEKIREYKLVDFFVYNKYIKIILPKIEIDVAE